VWLARFPGLPLSVFGVEWRVFSKPSVKEGRGSSPNMAIFIVNPNINQFLNEHEPVTLIVKTPAKITREHR
jgi:hypothetical protein